MNSEDKTAVLIKKILRKLHIKLNPKKEKLLIQIFKFLIVGTVATIIDFLFLIIFKEVFKLNTVLSNTLSFTISVIYNYIASVMWVFDVNKDKDKRKQFIIFIVFSIIGLIISDIIIWLLADKMLIHYLISKIIATFVVMVFNFVTRKLFLE